jgi:hypothetical protein
MAQITFKGFISKVAPKYVLVSESNRKKNEAGEWETVGYNNYWVWIPREQQGETFSEKTLVEITGRFQTEQKEKDGKVYTNLYVSADSIQVAQKANFGGAAASVTTINNAVDLLDAPF